MRGGFHRWLNGLLLAIPLAISAWFLNRDGPFAGQLTVWVFAFCLAALIPLAALIGQLTASLTLYLSQQAAGLVGASFGNVPELAIGIILLIHARTHLSQTVTVSSDLEVVHALLIGSVINNVLFVLGFAVLLGALRNGRMRFKAESAAGYASMMALAVVGLALPTLAIKLATDAPENASYTIGFPFSLILIVSYGAYLASDILGWGAKKHPAKHSGEAHEGEASVEEMETAGMPMLADDPSHETELEKEVQQEEHAAALEREKGYEYRKKRGADVFFAIGKLAAVTLCTVGIAYMLVSVTDNVITNTQLTPLSVGLILFPFVCNLGEVAGSVVSAWKNDMETTMSVAAGSSVQVALFVVPVLVLISYPLSMGANQTILQLLFEPVQLVVIGLTTFVYALVSLDGETTWLEGLQLLAFYAMIVAVAFALPGI